MIPAFPYLGPWLDGAIRSFGDIQGSTQLALDNFNDNAPTLAAQVSAAGSVVSTFLNDVPVVKIMLITVLGIALLRKIIGMSR